MTQLVMARHEDVDEINEYLKARREKIEKGEITPHLPKPGIGQRVAQAIFGKPKPKPVYLKSVQPTRASSEAQTQMRQQLQSMMNPSSAQTGPKDIPIIQPRSVPPSSAPTLTPLQAKIASLPKSAPPSKPAPAPAQKKPFSFAKLLPFMKSKPKMPPVEKKAPAPEVKSMGEKMPAPKPIVPFAPPHIESKPAPAPPASASPASHEKGDIPTINETRMPAFSSPFGDEERTPSEMPAPEPDVPVSPAPTAPAPTPAPVVSKSGSAPSGVKAPPFVPPWKKAVPVETKPPLSDETKNIMPKGSVAPNVVPVDHPDFAEPSVENKYADIPALKADIPKPKETIPAPGVKAEEKTTPIPALEKPVLPNVETNAPTSPKPTSFLHHLDEQRGAAPEVKGELPPREPIRPLPGMYEKKSAPATSTSESKPYVPPWIAREKRLETPELSPPHILDKETLKKQGMAPTPPQSVAESPASHPAARPELAPVKPREDAHKEPMGHAEHEPPSPPAHEEEDMENLTAEDWKYLEDREKEHEAEEREQASLQDLQHNLSRQSEQVEGVVKHEPEAPKPAETSKPAFEVPKPVSAQAPVPAPKPVPSPAPATEPKPSSPTGIPPAQPGSHDSGADDPKKEILRRLKKMIEDEHPVNQN